MNKRHCGDGACGHLITAFHDSEGCHAPARGRQDRFFTRDGYLRPEAEMPERVMRCACLKAKLAKRKRDAEIDAEMAQ